MLVSEVLNRAADLIEPEGAWTQNAYSRSVDGVSLSEKRFREGKCFCAIGAIAYAWRKSPSYAHNWEQSHKFPNVRSLGSWNDAPDRTQVEVVAKLREAAALAKEHGQ